jgi:hypothetical protein
MAGQEIATLFSGNVQAGKYNQVTFNMNEMANGLYFTKLESNGKVDMKKIMLVK